jgi:hypothetical protein
VAPQKRWTSRCRLQPSPDPRVFLHLALCDGACSGHYIPPKNIFSRGNECIATRRKYLRGFLPSTPLGFRLHVYHGCILRTTLSLRTYRHQNRLTNNPEADKGTYFDVHEMLRARSGRGDKSTALPRRQPVELRLMKIFVTRDKESWGGHKASSR